VPLYRFNEALHRVNDPLNQYNGSLHRVNVTLYRFNEALHRVNEPLNQYNESLHRVNVTLYWSNEALQRLCASVLPALPTHLEPGQLVFAWRIWGSRSSPVRRWPTLAR
jgi:hypothetical protein